ncbi:MAG: ATP-binding cassette domain-containing protein [Lachnospiraceae bacterium]|nr:ATP-binding cassette domain-containing protein [Lachnospiraceae bacterium]
MNKKIGKAGILLLWLCLWQLAAFLVNNPVYFASPAETVGELFLKIKDTAFWQSLASSLIRILCGFLTAFVLAFICAFVSLRFRLFRELISPPVSFLKSVPVAAVAVILLIWWGSRYLVLCICMMVVFPNIYANMLSGLEKCDKGLLEMASVFRLPFTERFLWIYRPAYLPSLHSAVSVSLGMCFKSGVAAEIIGLPGFSIGEQLYRDKIYLNSAGVFAWVIVILLLSALTEKLLLCLLRLLAKIPEACPGEGIIRADHKAAANESLPEGYTVFSDGVSKSFDGRRIIDTELKLKRGKSYYLKEPSGAGKTTLLKLIAGLETADSGSIRAGKLSMVFQEDRLIEGANGLRNLLLAGCRGELKEEYLKLLPEHTLLLPASKLSGGERRRLAIIRALLHPSDIVILDEPFTGLDEESRKKTRDWILRHLDGRTLLYTSHDTEGPAFPEQERISLTGV